MKQNIYIIGNNQSKIADIQQHLEGDYKITLPKVSQLFKLIYANRPTAMILIRDDLTRDTLLTIDTINSIEYIPTIAVSFSTNDYDKNLLNKNITNIQYSSNFSALIGPLLYQADIFRRHSILSQTTLDTYEIILQDVGKTMDQMLNYPSVEAEPVLSAFLHSVYSQNVFLDNAPRVFYIITTFHEERLVTTRFSPKDQSWSVSKLNMDEAFDLERFKETGFFYNRTHKEFSDIASSEELIPKHIQSQEESVENVAIYACDKVSCLALDYQNNIQQMDLNILKNLTLQLDLMMTLRERVVEIDEAYIYTMNALARAAEGKDDNTGNHIKRVNAYSALLARMMGLDEAFVRQIEVAAQMHDVGKIMIPDHILNKPGSLTPDEFNLIQKHSGFGARLIGDTKHLTMAKNIALNHHEKYDGSGYPRGLSGKEIPIEARIVALADVYDALRDARSYKPSFSHEKTMEIINSGDGRVEPFHFDPQLLEVFNNCHLSFNEIYEHYT